MAFAVRDLSVMAYARGFTLWHYVSKTDSMVQIATTGYFDAAVELFSNGDAALVNATDGTMNAAFAISGTATSLDVMCQTQPRA